MHIFICRLTTGCRVHFCIKWSIQYHHVYSQSGAKVRSFSSIWRVNPDFFFFSLFVGWKFYDVLGNLNGGSAIAAILSSLTELLYLGNFFFAKPAKQFVKHVLPSSCGLTSCTHLGFRLSCSNNNLRRSHRRIPPNLKVQ